MYTYFWKHALGTLLARRSSNFNFLYCLVLFVLVDATHVERYAYEYTIRLKRQLKELRR